MERMMSESNKDKDSFRIPSSADYISEAYDFLEGWLKQKNVPEDIIADIGIAVTELINNAIKHANKFDSAKKVTIKLEYFNNEVVVSVNDEGPGFEPDNIPNPVEEENLLKEVGRGLFIVKSLMDDVKFSFPPEGGSRITITKKNSR
jgi:serine/threonine-protein kinase RsbW